MENIDNGFSVRFLLIFFGIVGQMKCSSYKDAELLYRNITGKNNNIRPVLDQSRPVDVYVYFHLVYIQEFDEVNGKLSLTGLLSVNWKDETVSWNSSEYNIYHLTYRGEEFWRPLFLIGNAFDNVDYIYKDDSVKRVSSEGYMTWTPADNYEVTCEADVSRYPFDTHLCHMMLLPWGFTPSEVSVHHLMDHVATYWYSPHKTWEIIETSVLKADEPQRLYFYIKLKRQPLFFVLNLIIPIAVMCVLNVFVFLLPADSGERVGYAITVLLAIAVFLTISLDSLPATSYPRTPTISLVLMSDLVVSALIVILVILGLRLYHHKDQNKVSSIAKYFVRFIRCLRCKRTKRKEKHSEDNIVDSKFVDSKFVDYTIYRGTSSNTLASVSERSEAMDDITWSDVGETSDFVFFILITLIIITIHILYIVDVTVGLPWTETKVE